MARPKADVPPAEALRALIGEGGRIALRVTPGARTEGLEIAGGKLLARVRAAPEDGKANAAVAQMLASALGIAASRLQLLRGATARDKLFRVAL